MFCFLHPALRETCETIQFPPDNGCALMDEVHSSGSLFGVSDASFKNGRAAHAWIISSGKVDDISNPLLNISGNGMVHGFPNIYLPLGGNYKKSLQCPLLLPFSQITIIRR